MVLFPPGTLRRAQSVKSDIMNFTGRIPTVQRSICLVIYLLMVDQNRSENRAPVKSKV